MVIMISILVGLPLSVVSYIALRAMGCKWVCCMCCDDDKDRLRIGFNQNYAPKPKPDVIGVIPCDDPFYIGTELDNYGHVIDESQYWRHGATSAGSEASATVLPADYMDEHEMGWSSASPNNQSDASINQSQTDIQNNNQSMAEMKQMDTEGAHSVQ